MLTRDEVEFLIRIYRDNKLPYSEYEKDYAVIDAIKGHKKRHARLMAMKNFIPALVVL
jgi:hypothetical protein